MSDKEKIKKDKLPFFEKLMYGAGSGSFQMANDGVKQLAYPIFNITLGLSPALIGLVLTLSRFVDAFTDPLMGKISDDTRSRFGRRRPYIFVGSFLVAISFIALWFVPEGWVGNKLFLWYLFGMLIFYVCATIQTIPYHTLGLEMTPDYHERTSVSSLKMFFSFSFGYVTPWIFAWAQSDRYENTMHGMQSISFWIAGLILAGGVLPAIFVKERYYHIATNSKKIPFWNGMKLTFQNKSFLILTGVILTSGIGGSMVSALGPYIVFYHMFEGDTKAGAILSAQGANVFVTAAIVSLPILNWCSRRFGKVLTMRCLIFWGLIGTVTKFWLYSKEFPQLLFLSQIMVAPLAAGFWTLTTSMKADICDEDELINGSRREGVFGSVGNWVTKTTMASTFFIAGLVLTYTGFDVELKGDQAPGTILNMRILFSVIPSVSTLLSLLLLWWYPLNETRMAEIRSELEARRGKTDD